MKYMECVKVRGHSFILKADKPITTKQYNEWMRDVGVEYYKIRREQENEAS